MPNSIACVVLDVNAMQKVNDECGYEFGDRLLAGLDSILKTAFASAVVSRLAGDEFMLFETGLDSSQVASRLAVVAHEIERGFHVTLIAGVGFGRTATQAKRVAIKDLFQQKRMTLAKTNRREQ
jgi:diguanylate cyclase (GGDEF)-like protein